MVRLFRSKKKARLALKFHLLIVVPLLLLSSIVIFVTNRGLQNNATRLTDSLRIQAKTNQVLPLMLTQGDASKAMLIDPDHLSDFSEKKIDAYDKHRKLLKELSSEVKNRRMKRIVDGVLRLDDTSLQPIDTKVLEMTFENLEKARTIYFEEYEPRREQYETLVRKLAELGEAEATEANLDLAKRNSTSIIQIIAVLVLGISAISLTIFVLARQIERSDANMKSLLTGLTKGVFFFDRSGAISEERSAALSEILPGNEVHDSIHQFLRTYTNVVEEELEACLQLLWQDDDDGFMSEFSDIVAMLPQESVVSIEGEKRNLSFQYSQLKSQANKLDKVVVLVSDVTEQLRHEEEARRQSQRVKRLTKAASNGEAFSAFADEAFSLIENINGQLLGDPDQIKMESIENDLHTLKGAFAVFEFDELSTQIHQLEDRISEADPHGLDVQSLEDWKSATENWLEQYSDIKEVLRLGETEGKTLVSHAKLESLERLANKLDDKRLNAAVDGLFRRPISEVLKVFASYLSQLADRSADKEIQVVFDPRSSELNQGETKALEAVFTHIFRNCFDHGIEPADEREEVGKERAGTIEVSARRKKDGSVAYVIADDGRGIDKEALVQKAVGNGALRPEEAKKMKAKDKLSLIFHPGLSTRTEVSELSGRGVGMDAVKEAIEKLGGQISVTSRTGQGSRFAFEIPHQQQRRSTPRKGTRKVTGKATRKQARAEPQDLPTKKSA